MAVMIEGNWLDVYRVHQYLQGKGDAKQPIASLENFKRFPTWMWRNTTLPPFIQWLRKYNDTLNAINKIGFYGLDLYSLNASMKAVIQYLKKLIQSRLNKQFTIMHVSTL